MADPTHPEHTCEDCGRRNITWFAPSPIWNEVARADGTDPMLCPVCFAIRAEAKGIVPSAWKLEPEFTYGDVCTPPHRSYEEHKAAYQLADVRSGDPK